MVTQRMHQVSTLDRHQRVTGFSVGGERMRDVSRGGIDGLRPETRADEGRGGADVGSSTFPAPGGARVLRGVLRRGIAEMRSEYRRDALFNSPR